MAQDLQDIDLVQLVSDYLRVTGVAHIEPEPYAPGQPPDPDLAGKRLGLLNGSSWITLWANIFGRMLLPGVHLVNVGNEAIQLSFMEAHAAGLPTPPRSNIDAFVRYANDLVALGRVDAVLITCSTMSRAYPEVERALAPMRIPVVQIDRPMMAQAVALSEHAPVLVVATHGPTVTSTQALLRETAEEMGEAVAFAGITVESAWHRLATGDVAGHNAALAEAIRAWLSTNTASCVVLAQLSMSVFAFDYPNPVTAFGVPVLTSGQAGFEYVRDVLRTV